MLSKMEFELSESKIVHKQSSSIVCYKCNGTKHKRGYPTKPCKTCNATGILSDKLHQELQAHIKEFIDMSMPTAFLKMKDMMMSNQQSEEEEEEDEVWNPEAELKRQ